MIAYWQLDAAGVPDFLLLNSTDSLYAFTIPVQYPKVGATLSACRVGVVRASGGATVWMQSPGDPRNTYIAHMEWTPDGREIVFQHLNRKQTTLRLMAGDIGTGTVRTLLTEADSAWIDVVDDMRWFKDGASFAWISEATGWRNVVQVSRDGKPLRTLTPGKYDVIDLLALDEKAGFLYFIASPENATRRFLYRTRLDGRGHPERITPAGLNGYHSYEIAPNGRWAVHSWSTIDTPAATELVALPGHAVVRPLNDNALLKARVAALLPTPASFFRVDIGNGVVLDGWKILPAGFDSTKRYPVLFHVYGEPGGQTVIDRFGGTTFLWHRMLAQQGYIVVSVDNRGTPAPRGRSWRSCVYQKIGTLSSADQAAAARVIRRWPYVDSTRIGIWGWSGGGSTTLNMLFRYPELYHTGVAVAPVADLRLYDAVYQERYTGLLDESPDAYTQGSPITFAAHLRGNLLVIHGTGDDNVHYQGTERLINALVAANRQFSMLAYPNRSHGIFERENTTRHLYTAITEYLRAHLPPGAGR
jgi:dipeptidyl-peptidase-4